MPTYGFLRNSIGVDPANSILLSGEMPDGSKNYPPNQLFGVRSDGTIVELRIDPLEPWLATVDGPHSEIHKGKRWTYHDIVTLASGGVQDYLLTCSAAAPHFEYSVDGFYGVTLEMFEATGKTQSAAAEATFNRNRNITTASGMTIKKGTNGGTGDGTRLVWKKSGSGTTAGKLAGFASDRSERVLKASTAYIFRVTSMASSNSVGIEFDWYE